MFRKIVLILIVLFLLTACQKTQQAQSNAINVPEKQEVPSEIPIVEEAKTCEYNTDCAENLLCINKECKTLASLYETDCEQKCTITSVKVKTSDDEEYDLGLGQGSYTAAGALEWKLLKTPDYCPGSDPLVAIEVIKKTTGKIVGEQVLTLHKGDTSEEITHPTVKRVKFTAQLEEVTESC